MIPFFFFSFLMSTEFSCARVDAVFVHRHGQKSHIKGMKWSRLLSQNWSSSNMSSEGFESLIKENVVLIDYKFISTLLINVFLC